MKAEDIGEVSVLRGLPLVAQTVKRLPTMWGTWVQSLGWEDLLEKEMTSHSSILAWEAKDRGAWQATVHGVTKSWIRLNTHARTHAHCS